MVREISRSEFKHVSIYQAGQHRGEDFNFNSKPKESWLLGTLNRHFFCRGIGLCTQYIHARIG
jgi:hypothetical protein